MPAQNVATDILVSPEAQARFAGPVNSFLVEAGNGSAPYSGSLFGH
jgi:hypothetical protein